MLGPNELIYSFGDPSNVEVDTVSPTGSNDSLFYNFGGQILLAVPNPKSVQFAFAYQSNVSLPTYDIYVNSSVSATGATRLTNQSFGGVTSIQFTADGSKILFVAQDASLMTSTLYVVNPDGTGLTPIDNADDAYVALDKHTVCYTKVDSNNNGQIWKCSTNGSGKVQLTNDNWDHFAPQISKDVTQIAWAAAPSGVSYDIYSMALSGSTLKQVTHAGGDNAVSPCWGSNGNQIGYVLEAASNTTLSGIYVASADGSSTSQIVPNAIVNEGLAWTDANGFFFVTRSTGLVGRSFHVVRLRRRGFRLR